MRLVLKRTRSSLSVDLSRLFDFIKKSRFLGWVENVAQDVIFDSIAEVVFWDFSASLADLKNTSFGTPKIGGQKTGRKPTFSTFGTSKIAETPRSLYGGTFHGYPVSKCHRTLWVAWNRVLTQLRLLIYCLVYGPLKTGFWTPKIGFWGVPPYFGVRPLFWGYPKWPPSKLPF